MSILLLSIQKCINRLNTELVSKLCFNVWGCFSWNGVGDLHRVKGILTGPEYRKILIHHLVPSANQLNPEGFIFQQDNDPILVQIVEERFTFMYVKFSQLVHMLYLYHNITAGVLLISKKAGLKY